jgi:hypothetical protein
MAKAIGKPTQQSMEKMNLKGNTAQSKSMSGKGGFVAPAEINMDGRSITFGDEKQYEYFVDHPMELFMCCFTPMECCSKQADFRRRFFMEFEREGDVLKYMVGKNTEGMCATTNFVEVGRYKKGGGDIQLIGHLGLPCRCAGIECLANYQDTCKECLGQDILLMAFTDSFGKQVMTIRKVGSGCNTACCVQKCCACDKCGCPCKGFGMDGCCGKLGFSTRMDEVFHVYGPMEEEAREPKAVLRLIWRRALVYGMPNFVPVKFCIEPRGDIKDENLLLLIGLAYGMCWQTKYGMAAFPNLLGQLTIPGLGPVDRE